MTNFVLSILAILDFVIIGFLFLYIHKKQGGLDLLHDLTEERRILNKLRTDVQQELLEGKRSLQTLKKESLQVAAEIERDSQTSKENLSKHLQSVFDEFTDKLDIPMVELTKKHHLLDSLLRKVEFEKTRLIKAIEKGEKICKFFQNDLPYEELLKDIEYKKYDDARKLLTQGYSKEKVASELGMRIAEVELLQGITLG